MQVRFVFVRRQSYLVPKEKEGKWDNRTGLIIYFCHIFVYLYRK